MQLQAGIKPLDSSRKFTLKFWERVRRVDYRYWNEYICAIQRLKTQTSSLSHVELLMKKHQLPLLMTHRALIQFYSTVTTTLPSKRLKLTNMTSNKADVIPEELKSCPLETIEERYPLNEWLHIYTDGSYLPETNGAGAGWFCRLFEGSLAVEKNATNYDGEVLAVCEATTHSLSAGLPSANAELKLQSSFHMAGLRPYSGSQVVLGSSAMKEPTKKPNRERSRLNRKSP
ncbi:reverse transcriptase [Trichonephila clavipes]|nr:reverse transcriptase [Trichonephila clavipes]